MKKRFAVVALLLAVAVGIWWSHRGSPPEVARQDDVAEAAAPSAPARGSSRVLNAVLEAPVPPPEGELSLAGQVIDAMGAPVPHAIVIATAATGDDVLSSMPCRCDNDCGEMLLECACAQSAVQLAQRVAERRGEAPPVARGETDAEGHFTLTGLSAGQYALWAERRGVGIAVSPSVAAGSDGNLLRLEVGMSLSGRVVDRASHPIPGAVVTAIYVKNSRFFDAVSGADGAFRIALLPLGEFSVVASADGFLPAHRKVHPDRGSTGGIDLTLETPRALSGTVVRDGQPVPRAKVVVHGQHRRVELISDARGGFRATGLSPGTYDVQGSEGGDVGVAQANVDPEADATGIAVELSRGGLIVGRVVDEGGAPVKAELWAGRRGEASGSPARTTSDAEGRFTFSALVPDEYRLSVKAKGFQPLDEAVLAEATPSPGAPVIITLHHGASVQGTVRDPDGAPLADAVVSADRVRDATTAKDGSFTLEGLAPGSVELSVSHAQFLSARTTVNAPAEGVEIRLGRGGRILGTVLDAEGNPLAGAEIGARLVDGHVSATSRSGAKGDFSVQGLEDGTYRVSAQVGEPEALRSVSATAEVKAGSAPPVTLRFAKGSPLSGVVVDPTGAPIADAKVFVFSGRSEDEGPGDFRNVHSGPEGRFQVTHLQSAKLRVGAQKEGFGMVRPVEASAGDQDVRVVLQPLGRITGRVLDPDGQALSELRVNGAPAHPGPDGRFQVDRHRPGTLSSVSLEAPHFAPAVVSVSAKAGESVDVGDVRLQRGRRLDGEVVSADGAVVRHAEVFVRFEHGGSDDQETDVQGRFHFDNVPEGGAELRVDVANYAAAERSVAADEAHVQIVLSSGAKVSGHVRGMPAGARGFVAAADADGSAVPVEKDGSYTLAGLEDGHHTLHLELFSRDGLMGVRASKEVDVAQGQPARVDFDLTAGVVVRVSNVAVRSVGFLVRGKLALPSKLEDFLPDVMESAMQEMERHASLQFPAVSPGEYTLLLLLHTADGKLSAASLALTVGTQDVSVDAALARPGPTYEVPGEEE